MAQVTVQQLAETVGAPVERLLAQMKDAGLPHKEAAESVSDEDKKKLLAFLKRSHGEATSGPRKITLKRKSVSTLRAGSGAGRKTVNVEVRKKRTYVKRDLPDEVRGEELVEEAPAAELPVEEAPAAEESPVTEPAVAEAPAPEPEIPEEDEKDLDPEVLRQRAAARRKRQEEEEAKARAAAIEARKAEAERK
ncbi:MAG: translation initiation factor IF-2 associated domain-containing protein, partial [Halieaceae bacterium]|nr:translation initiation factor IF-2 associated domain-containing protein [Halieaceae bacterium]